jgi:hypothetical protein
MPFRLALPNPPCSQFSPLTGDRGGIPFTFSLASKSQLGWDFLGLIDSGRFQDYDPHHPQADREAAHLAHLFWQQVEACTYEVRPGPGRLMSWAVPDPRTHDDLLISAALAAVLDTLDWRPRTAKGRIEHDRSNPAWSPGRGMTDTTHLGS